LPYSIILGTYINITKKSKNGGVNSTKCDVYSDFFGGIKKASLKSARAKWNYKLFGTTSDRQIVEGEIEFPLKSALVGQIEFGPFLLCAPCPLQNR